jgi:hypothetical protein
MPEPARLLWPAEDVGHKMWLGAFNFLKRHNEEGIKEVLKRRD